MTPNLKKLFVQATKGKWVAIRSDMATVVQIYAGDKYVAIASGQAVTNWDEVMTNAKLIAALMTHGEALVEALEHAQILLQQCARDGVDPGAAYTALNIENLLAALERDAGEGL